VKAGKGHDDVAQFVFIDHRSPIKQASVSADNVPGTPQANPLDRFVVRRAGDVT
jgi:hypothetical protein